MNSIRQNISETIRMAKDNLLITISLLNKRAARKRIALLYMA